MKSIIKSGIIIIFVIIFVWMVRNREEVGEHFYNKNPFLTVPPEMITWKPFSMNLENQPNYSAYFYRNLYMYPIY